MPAGARATKVIACTDLVAAARLDAKVGPVRSEAVEREFTAFFQQQYGQVTRTVYFIVHDRERAEDVAQDAFVQLFRHWPKISGYERPDAWVRRIAIRLAMRVVRRERLWSVVKRDVRQVAPIQPRDLDVMDAVRRLPAMQRAAIALFYFEDRPISQVADLLGCAEPTARVHLHRGRRRLAELLGEEDPDAA